ncbi:MAG: RNA methyltransferase [Pseudomonadota bacterium]
MKFLTSRDNPKFKDLLALASRARVRREQRQTLLDGEHLLTAALEAGLLPRMMLFADHSPEALMDRWQASLPEVPCYSLARALFRELSPVDTPSGLLAVVDIPQSPSAVEDGSAFLLLLENIQDPGNLGALMRVAAAAGCRRVCLSSGCAEAWSPKSLRGGQGAQFQLQIVENADLVAEAAGWPGPVHAGLLGAKSSLYDLDLRGPTGFAFGNEGAGLSPALQAACSPFSIPMPGRVESLNVATAAAVCLFEGVRQRGAQIS